MKLSYVYKVNSFYFLVVDKIFLYFSKIFKIVERYSSNIVMVSAYIRI